MYSKNGTRNKIVRYLVSDEFILDSVNTILPKPQNEYYYKYPVAVTLCNDGKINIKDTLNNRRYVFDDKQSVLIITQFIEYLGTSPNTFIY